MFYFSTLSESKIKKIQVFKNGNGNDGFEILADPENHEEVREYACLFQLSLPCLCITQINQLVALNRPCIMCPNCAFSDPVIVHQQITFGEVCKVHV